MNKLNDLWRNINYWPRRKWRQIKNVIGWIPVVWNQFDFDYRYSLDVFKHQLLKQAKFMESDKAYGVNSHIDAQKIRMVVRLMDKVYDEEYMNDWHEGKIEFKEAMKKQERAHKLLWKLIEFYIRGWWD